MVLDSYPFATLAFASFTRGVATGKRIKDQIAGIGKESKKKGRYLNRKTCRMRLDVVQLTQLKIATIGVVVAMYQ
jgi:hypothetical protein